jgi:SAM-dependent methyltransferase
LFRVSCSGITLKNGVFMALSVTPADCGSSGWVKIAGTRLFSRQYRGIPGRIHLHDTMLQNDSVAELDHYQPVGVGAVRIMTDVLQISGMDFSHVRSCLHLGCGYGRVILHLVDQLELFRITTCPCFQGRRDVIPQMQDEAIRFNLEEYGVRTHKVELTAEVLEFPQKYELIWAGAVITNLQPHISMQVIDQLVHALAPGGILIFTTQSTDWIEEIERYGFMFENRTEDFRHQARASGTAYLPYYSSDPDYGIT